MSDSEWKTWFKVFGQRNYGISLDDGLAFLLDSGIGCTEAVKILVNKQDQYYRENYPNQFNEAESLDEKVQWFEIVNFDDRWILYSEFSDLMSIDELDAFILKLHLLVKDSQ